METELKDLSKEVEQAVRENGEEHQATALAIMELGDAYELVDDFSGAETQYSRAANIYRTLGADHELLLAIALKSQAEVAKRLNKNEEARQLKDESRKLMRKACNRSSDSVDDISFDLRFINSNSEFYGSDQHDGEHRHGSHQDGDHHDGDHHGGDHRGGDLHDGRHHDGRHHDGRHHDGKHHDSNQRDSVQHDSAQHEGSQSDRMQ